MITRSNPSRPLSVLGLAAALATGVLTSASVANAQATVAILHSFTGFPTDGANAWAALIQGPDGTLYGTTRYGGSGFCFFSGCGTVFQLAPDGTGYMVLHSFTGFPTDGANAWAALIQGLDGTLYGTTEYGGINDNGTVFQMAPDGSGYAVLHSFAGSDGRNPRSGLVQDPDGTLYGTTYSGGTSNLGTIFQMAPDGSGFAVLHNFTGSPTDGANPYAGLVQDPDGTLYGTTYYGGTSNLGTIFQMAPDSSGFAVLHNFTGSPTDGAQAYAGLTQGPDGTLYGATIIGGTSNQGTIFQMAPDGTGYMVLHGFTGFTGGSIPGAGLIQGLDGALYGTTQSGGINDRGTVFQMAPDGSGYAILHSFAGGGTDGADANAGLIQAPDGTLYGTTIFGGTSNLGVVFQLTLSPSAPTSGHVGHK